MSLLALYTHSTQLCKRIELKELNLSTAYLNLLKNVQTYCVVFIFSENVEGIVCLRYLN